MKITDLAVNLIQLSGLELKDDNNPYGEAEFTRPGEKLFEELLIENNIETVQEL